MTHPFDLIEAKLITKPMLGDSEGFYEKPLARLLDEKHMPKEEQQP